MLEQIIEPTLLTQFKEALENSGNVVVTCHKSPDGDAAGSNLALKLILDKLGKKATVVTPDNVPEDMAFLPGYDNIVSFAKDPEMAAETINAADLICCLDFYG
uniref:DHH family phosphoesterase n=1 Tax=Candidatus Limisoma sp. TaxID=3076476 RepID=UPI003FED47F7